MRSVFLALASCFAAAAFAACSAAGAISNGNPSDAGVAGDRTPPVNDDGAYGPTAIPSRVFAIHAAHMQAFAIGDVRLCPSADSAQARPSDNRIPRASYPGIGRGGFAEIENPGSWTAPFALDAYGLGLAESQTTISCAQLDGNFYVKARLAPLTLARPGLVALVDGQGGIDAGTAPELVSIPVAAVADPPAIQIVDLSPDLISPRLIVRRGPLDGKCTPGDLYDGQGTYAAALNAPIPFVRPTGNFDDAGIQVCVAPLNGAPALVISRSWADLQAASVPEMVPGDFYAQNALFVIVLMGEKAAVDPSSQLHAVMIPFNVTR